MKKMFYLAVAIVAMSSASAMFTSCDKFFGGKDNDTTIVESNVIPDDSLNASNNDSLKAANEGQPAEGAEAKPAEGTEAAPAAEAAPAEAAPAPAEKAATK